MPIRELGGCDPLKNDGHYKEYGFTFSEFRRLISARKWVIALCVLLSVLIARLYARVEAFRFVSSSTVSFIKSDSNNQISFYNVRQSVEPGRMMDGGVSPVIQYLPIFQSESFMRKVASLLLVNDHLEVLRFSAVPQNVGFIDWIKWIGKNGLVPYPPQVVTGEDLISNKQSAISILQSMVKFIPDADRATLKVEVTTSTPASSAFLANTISDAVVNYMYSKDLISVLETKTFIEKQLKIYEQRLKESGERFVQFKQKNRDVSLPHSVEMVASGLADYEKKLREIETRIESNNKLLTYLQTKRMDDFRNELRLRRMLLISEGLSEKHEEVRLIDKKLESIISNAGNPLIDEVTVSKDVNNLLEEAKRLAAEASSVKTILKNLQNDTKTIPRKELQRGTHELQVKLDAEIYESLSKRYQDIQIMEAAIRSERQVLMRAVPPSSPANLRSAYRLILSAICGFLISIGGILLSQALYSPVRTLKMEPVDRERDLCNFPQLSGRSETLEKSIDLLKKDNTYLLASEQRNPNIAFNPIYGAAFKLLDERGTRRQVILVTSSAKGEGKSVIAANLAIGLSNTQRKTLLIDGNLDNPEIQNLFKIPFSLGIGSTFNGNADVNSAILETRYSKLDVLLAGVADQSSKNISFSNISNMFEMLRPDYEIVVIDAGTVGLSSSTMVWANFATDIVVVASHGKTLHESLHESIYSVSFFRRAKIWTCLNNVPVEDKTITRQLLSHEEEAA